jgi:VWFA-related protein
MVFNGGVKRLLLFVLLAGCVAAQPAASQSRRRPGRGNHGAVTAPPPPRTFAVDAAATDLPLNLTGADFSLELDGNPVTLDAASLVTQKPRSVVVVVDDAGLSLQGAERIKAALERLIHEQLQPEDHAAIVRARSGTGILESLTGDHRLLGEAIAQIRFDPSQGADKAADERLVLAGDALAVRRALNGLAGEAGRKAVVLVSENLALLQRHGEIFAGFDARAADNSAVFYTLDASDTTARKESGILDLTGATGGLNIGLDLASGFAAVLRDQAGYYRLTFKIDSGAPTPVHTMVRLKNAATLRFRSRPLGQQPPETFRSTGAESAAAALNSPYAGSAIPVVISTFYGSGKLSTPTVTVLVWLDVAELAFVHQLNGMHSASAAVLTAAFDGNGVTTDSKSATLHLELTDADYRKDLKEGWMFRLELGVRPPGTRQIRVAVRDETSGRMGAASQLADFPDLLKGALLVSNIAMSMRNDNGASGEELGRRIFPPGAVLKFAYQILNPFADPQKPEDLEIALRLFRDGGVIYTGNPQLIAAKTLEDPTRRSLTGELTLSADTPPGHYFLEVSVGAKQGAKPRQGRQWTEFDVRP